MKISGFKSIETIREGLFVVSSIFSDGFEDLSIYNDMAMVVENVLSMFRVDAIFYQINHFSDNTILRKSLHRRGETKDFSSFYPMSSLILPLQHAQDPHRYPPTGFCNQRYFRMSFVVNFPNSIKVSRRSKKSVRNTKFGHLSNCKANLSQRDRCWVVWWVWNEWPRSRPGGLWRCCLW